MTDTKPCASLVFHIPTPTTTTTLTNTNKENLKVLDSKSIRLVNPLEGLLRFVAILQPTSLANSIIVSPQSGLIEGRGFSRLNLDFVATKNSQKQQQQQQNKQSNQNTNHHSQLVDGYLELHYWRRPKHSQLIRTVLKIDIKSRLLLSSTNNQLSKAIEDNQNQDTELIDNTDITEPEKSNGKKNSKLRIVFVILRFAFLLSLVGYNLFLIVNSIKNNHFNFSNLTSVKKK